MWKRLIASLLLLLPSFPPSLLRFLQNSGFLSSVHTPSISLSILSLLNPSFIVFRNCRGRLGGKKGLFAIIFNHMRPSQSRLILVITFTWVSGFAASGGRKTTLMIHWFFSLFTLLFLLKLYLRYFINSFYFIFAFTVSLSASHGEAEWNC